MYYDGMGFCTSGSHLPWDWKVVWNLVISRVFLGRLFVDYSLDSCKGPLLGMEYQGAQGKRNWVRAQRDGFCRFDGPFRDSSYHFSSYAQLSPIWRVAFSMYLIYCEMHCVNNLELHTRISFAYLSSMTILPGPFFSTITAEEPDSPRTLMNA